MADVKILVNVFHPDLSRSRGNRVLIDAIAGLDNVTVRDLYADYPDFKIDTDHEQRLLCDHDVIVFQHPLYWYSSPALLKQWQDHVLTPGFAFPPGVGDALKGKAWQSVITAGGDADAYRSGGMNNFSIDELLRPFQKTATMCSMVWRDPFVVHGVLPENLGGRRSITDEELADRASDYRVLIASMGL